MATVAVLCLGCVATAAEDLLTTAERSDFTATSTYEEVMALCRSLAQYSNHVALSEFGHSEEGRALPLLIASTARLTGPPDRNSTHLPVILMLGNLHGGEVCGKEALLMLARELAQQEKPAILDEFILLFAPIYNADGNERFGKDNRPEQNGPRLVGRRENARGLDLNRDYIKLEAAETRALVRLLNQWDPAVVIDTHATDGSKHRYAITYDGPRHPATSKALFELVRDTFLPETARRLKETSGYESFHYGNFRLDHTRWETYPALPRYGTHYAGLRNRIFILSEAYSHAPFKDRVLATKEFVRQCWETARIHKKTILTLSNPESTKDRGDPSDRLTVPPSDRPLPLRSQLAGWKKDVNIRGYLETKKDKDSPPTPKDYSVELWLENEVTREVKLPEAYLIPADFPGVVTNLQQHGITVQILREDINLDVECYLLGGTASSPAPTQRHQLVEVNVTPTNRAERVSAGTFVVPTSQKLGRLAAYLLEPEAEDGLTAWNFFDGRLQTNGVFPVRRLAKPIPLLTAAARALPEDRTFHRRITLEVYESRPNLSGSPTRVEGWLKDGNHYLQVRAGQLHRVHAATGRARSLFDPAKVEQALAKLPGMDDKTARNLSRQPRWQMNPAATGALFDHQEDLYLFNFDGMEVVRLTRQPGREELATFSPDGRIIAFVRADNLFVVDIATRTEVALTTDGGGAVRNGKADWAYFEEIYLRKWQAYWWSPDSTQIAFHRFDDSDVPVFQALDTIPLHGKTEIMHHPKPGDPNPKIALGVINVAGGPINWVNLDNYLTGSFLVSRVGWLPGGKEVYFYVQDRAQTWLDMLVWSATTTKPQRKFREKTPAWVEDPGESYFLENGDVLFVSDRSGWRHLYRFAMKDQSWHPVTSGEWEIRRVELVSETNNWIYFTGTTDSEIGENLYRCHLDGSGMKRLTGDDGHHQISMAPEGRWFAATKSDVHNPERVDLYRGNGKHIRALDINPVFALEEYDLQKTELVRVPAKDGFEMNGTLLMPRNFSAERQYPVWLKTYAGPKAPSVRNAWDGARLHDQLLAESGLVVFRLDPRSASGRNSASAWTAYRQLGVQELADITDGVNWLKEKPFVDGARVGLSGFSYGGFMTAYAMTHSDLFAAGIAGGAVTDWRYYDSIYTERYMDVPQNNPEGYDRTSVVKAAAQLRGRLLLLHGMMDDNVHLQNATAFMDALQKANKQFEVMFYPQMKHGVSGAHHDRLTFEFIQRTMLSPESSSHP